MTADRLSALLAEAPSSMGLERASQLDGPRLPVLPVFEQLLPDRGLRPGTTTTVTGVGATSLALALVARASAESWTAVVGISELGLKAASELGIDLDRLVVIEDPGKRAVDVMAALVDAFDVVVAHPHLPTRESRRLAGRVRERDAVVVMIGRFDHADLSLHGEGSTWHGLDDGHGHLAARTIDVVVTRRRAAARPRRATLWLPDHEGEVRLDEPSRVVDLARSSPERRGGAR
jgi:hypothetical protein